MTPSTPSTPRNVDVSPPGGGTNNPGGGLRSKPVTPGTMMPTPEQGPRAVPGGGPTGTVTPIGREGGSRVINVSPSRRTGDTGGGNSAGAPTGGGLGGAIPAAGITGGRAAAPITRRFSDIERLNPADDGVWGDGSGGGAADRRRYDHPCYDWDHVPRRHRHRDRGWSFHFSYNTYGWCGPTYINHYHYYPGPSYWYWSPGYWWTPVTWCRPAYGGWYDPWFGWRTYRPGWTVAVSVGDWWGGWGTVAWSAPVTTLVYDPVPRYGWASVVDEVCEPAPVVYRPSEPRYVYVAKGVPKVVEVELPSFRPTAYRSDDLAGILAWEDTPERIVGTVRGVPDESRAQSAASFLGRVPAGAWELAYEDERVIDGRRVLLFRGSTPDAFGRRVLVLVAARDGTPRLIPGQRAQVTGRLAEIMVDDPWEQGGRLVLEDASIRV